jgi:hypothetical protein
VVAVVGGLGTAARKLTTGPSARRSGDRLRVQTPPRPAQPRDLLQSSAREGPTDPRPDLILLIKALTTIESVASTLDPEFGMVEFARPHGRARHGASWRVRHPLPRAHPSAVRRACRASPPTPLTPAPPQQDRREHRAPRPG